MEDRWLERLFWWCEQQPDGVASKVVEHIDDAPVRMLESHLILLIELALLQHCLSQLVVVGKVEHGLDCHLFVGLEHHSSTRIVVGWCDDAHGSTASLGDESMRWLADSKVSELGHSHCSSFEGCVGRYPTIEQQC